MYVYTFIKYSIHTHLYMYFSRKDRRTQAQRHMGHRNIEASRGCLCAVVLCASMLCASVLCAWWLDATVLYPQWLSALCSVSLCSVPALCALCLCALCFCVLCLCGLCSMLLCSVHGCRKIFDDRIHCEFTVNLSVTIESTANSKLIWA